MLELSVVIPTWNRIGTLRTVMAALLRSDLRPDVFEIIVADSNSTDGTAEFLAEVMRERANVRYLPGAYTGRAMARNAGIEAARGGVVLFTDADIIAEPNLISRHLAHHRERTGIAVVGQELQVGSVAEYETLRDDPSRRRPLHPQSRRRLSWLYFLTGNASVRRADLDRVGRFDENFTGYGHEDLELGYRLEEAGIRIIHDSSAVNYHWHPVPYDEQKGKYELAGRSTVRFYRKHPTLAVNTRLGMTSLSLGVHSLLQRTPGLVRRLDRAGEKQRGLARELVYQYHYVGGIKAALGAPGA